IVLTVRVLARPGTPSKRMWPFARRPSKSRSTRYFWPITTRPTCSRNGGIQFPISWTCCVISCVDFIRKVRQVRREGRSIKTVRDLATPPKERRLRFLGATAATEQYRQSGKWLGRANPTFQVTCVGVAEQLRL